MEKIMLILCWWWLGQCLCHDPMPSGVRTNPPVSSTRHKVTGQWLPSLSTTLIGGSESSRNTSQPVPGISENTYHNKENIPPSTLPVNKSEKVDNSSEHMTPSVRPPLNTNIDDHENARTNTSSSTDATTDSQSSLPEVLHSNHEIHTHAHDHNPVYEVDHLPVPESSTTGGGRDGRVTTPSKDLCSNCLCDTTKENVFCKHDHVDHNGIHHLTLNRQTIPPSAKTLHIVGFEKVVVVSNTFSRENLELRSIHFENIELMELHTKSLHFSPIAELNMEVAVIFTNCSIPKMPQHTFTQLTRSEDTRLDTKLEKTRFMSLKIDRCIIEEIHSYALYNARVIYFHMVGTKVNLMEENSVHLDSFDDWIIEKSQLPNMIHKAVCLRAQGIVVFSHNTFIGIGNRSLNIISSNQVLFEFNKVSHLGSEALLGIQPQKDSRAANVVFLNNTILKADERSLLTDSRYPMHERKIINNMFNISCDCQVMTAFESLLGITSSSDYEDIKMFQVVTRRSFCKGIGSVKSYIKVQAHMTHNCTVPITIIAAGTAVGVVILILVVVCVVCNYRVRKAREEANYLGECCFSQSFSTLHSNPQPLMSPISGLPGQPWDPTSPLQPWVMAVPEVKTYKETELNVSYEHTEPMNVSLRESFPLEPGQILDLQRRTQMRSSCPFN